MVELLTTLVMPLPTTVQMEDERRRMEEMEVELPIGVMGEHLLLLDIISRYDIEVDYDIGVILSKIKLLLT